MCQPRALGGRDLDPENLGRAGGLAADFIERSLVLTSVRAGVGEDRSRRTADVGAAAAPRSADAADERRAARTRHRMLSVSAH